MTGTDVDTAALLDLAIRGARAAGVELMAPMPTGPPSRSWSD